jgi:pimeloyl-ACP methyl ester carboxylesterase
LSAASRTIVFAHANGFPAGTYRVLFERWREAGWTVRAPEKLGHDPRYPVSSNWPHLRDELIEFVCGHAAGRPAWLVGHSLGGYLSLKVACQRPELAAGVLLLDAPLIGGWRARGLGAAKATGLIRRMLAGRVARRRRAHWPSASDAQRHFAAKPLFARWDPRVLADYLAAGIEPAPSGGARLAYRREVEAAIYNALPHHLERLWRRRAPPCPVRFIGGLESAELRLAGMAATLRLTRGQVRWVRGSHLFPMEHPDATADAVLEEIASMSA